MIKRITDYFFGRSAKKGDFSSFFRDATAKQKEEVILGAVRKANKEQRELVERYRKIHMKTT